MAKPSKENLEQAKRIAARMLAMPPEPHKAKAIVEKRKARPRPPKPQNKGR